MAKITIELDTSEIREAHVRYLLAFLKESKSDAQRTSFSNDLNDLSNVTPSSRDPIAQVKHFKSLQDGANSPEDAKKVVIESTKEAIIYASNYPGGREDLTTEKTFSELAFNTMMFTQLAALLTVIVIQHNGKNSVTRKEVSDSKTIGKCIEMILLKTNLL